MTGTGPSPVPVLTIPQARLAAKTLRDMGARVRALRMEVASLAASARNARHSDCIHYSYTNHRGNLLHEQYEFVVHELTAVLAHVSERIAEVEKYNCKD